MRIEEHTWAILSEQVVRVRRRAETLEERAPVLKLRKSEREKREWGSTPPHQSFPLQRCLVIFIYWDDFARNPVAWLCPPTLWYVAWFLAGCPQRKRGRGVSQRDPQRKKHGSQSTPRKHHTPYHIHVHTQTAHQMMRGGEKRGGGGGLGIRHWLLLKGQWFVSSTVLEEHGSHLNEYPIKHLEVITAHAWLPCSVHAPQRAWKRERAKVRRGSRESFFHACVEWTKNTETASGFISLIKMSTYKTGWHVVLRHPHTRPHSLLTQESKDHLSHYSSLAGASCNQMKLALWSRAAREAIIICSGEPSPTIPIQ